MEPTDKEQCLWKLLDDIDTNTDRYHPVNGEQSMQGWYEKVQEIIQRRHKIIHSPDGQKLIYTT